MAATVVDYVRAYQARGWTTIRARACSKKPIGDDWPTRGPDPVESFAPSDNVGVVLGTASGGLIDVDLDCAEATVLGPLYLPATWTFGRTGPGKVAPVVVGLTYARRRHYLYVCPEITKIEKVAHVEIRSDGGQSIFPGSAHEDGGEPIEWMPETLTPGGPTVISADELRSAVNRLRIASTIARAVGGGDVHDSALTLAGTLWRAGWPEADAAAVILPALELAHGADNGHRADAVRDTYADDHGRNRYGLPTLARLIGDKDSKTIDRLAHDQCHGYTRNVAGGELSIPTGESVGTMFLAAPTNDDGNATRLVERHGEDLRYAHGVGWLRWSGVRWVETDGPVYEVARLSRDMQAAGQAMGGPVGKALAEWGRQSGNAPKIAGCISVASAHPTIHVDGNDLDRDPWVLNCPNGTLDLRTGELRAADRADLITKVAGVEYDPAAKCPKFIAFLTQCMGGDLGLVRYLIRFLGYGLTGSVDEHVLGVWHGAGGANGKGTTIRIAHHVMGAYAVTVAPEILLQTLGSQHPTGLMDFRGARLVTSNECPEGKRWNEALVKQLTGGDRIKGRSMRRNFVEFDPTHKLLLAANSRPLVREQGGSFWRRVQLVPWEVSFAGREDPYLDEKLRAEGSGILTLLAAGARAWYTGGKRLEPPPVMVAAAEDYRESQDTIGAFLEWALVDGDKVDRSAVYRSYVAWCETGGEPFKLSARAFFRVLEERGLKQARTAKGRFFLGKVLRSGASTC